MRPYQPQYHINSNLIQLLGKIEAAKEIVHTLPLPLELEMEWRQVASAKISHYSTKIEGNPLTLKQTKELIAGKEVLAREVDKKEVRNYYECLGWIVQKSKTKEGIGEKTVKEIHSIIQKGIVQGKLRGQYRESQNAIYDAKTSKPIFFPPETKEVPSLMKSLMHWLNHSRELHPVLKAGIAHYQLVAIHPFMDGNGRTARALATFILYREGYDLKQLYSLEEYYAKDLSGYYAALHRCQGTIYHENPNPDISTWLDYFVKGTAIVFEEVKEKALMAAKKSPPARTQKEIELLQILGPREKRLLSYFRQHLQLKTKNVCSLFHLQERAARDWLQKWIKIGLILRQGTGKRNTFYVLSVDYRQVIGS